MPEAEHVHLWQRRHPSALKTDQQEALSALPQPCCQYALFEYPPPYLSRPFLALLVPMDICRNLLQTIGPIHQL
uniref:Uncharacterized protein n=1 Tax=Romanomermis culicivorax TaxID=13658 RepID=A0A915K0K2_ROMCU